MTTYTARKKAARNKIIALQNLLSVLILSYGELADIQADIEKLGRRYGLLTELREEGII